MPGGEREASPGGAGWRWGGKERPRAAAPQRHSAPCPPPAPLGVDWLLSLVSITNLCAGAARAAFIQGKREGRSLQPGRISAGGLSRNSAPLSPLRPGSLSLLQCTPGLLLPSPGLWVLTSCWGWKGPRGLQGPWGFGSLVFCLVFAAPLVSGLLNSAPSERPNPAVSA